MDKLKQLESSIAALNNFRTTVYVEDRGFTVEILIGRDIQLGYVQLHLFRQVGLKATDALRADGLSEAFAMAAQMFSGATLHVGTITVAKDGTEISANDELYKLTVQAWCEQFELTAGQSGSALTDIIQARNQLLKNTLWQHLIDGPAGITRWNSRPKEERLQIDWQQSQLAGAQLASADLGEMNLARSNFNGAVMNDTRLFSVKLQGCKFCGTKLVKADLSYAVAGGADFTDADLSKAKLYSTNLRNAALKNTNLSKANLRDSDLGGVDLTTSKLTDANFAEAKYDEKTMLPSVFPQWSQLIWRGAGLDPYQEHCKKSMQSLNLNNFADLINYLRSDFDKGRIDKVIKMLQQESFQLFSELNDQSVAGVVKSQTDPNLLYACELTSDGRFSCCTQNLRNCGGLKGSLCKHILVLLIGLTKSGQIELMKAARWVVASKMVPPVQAKESLAEIFLKYKSPEREIDWRPTETMPEDYYAF